MVILNVHKCLCSALYLLSADVNLVLSKLKHYSDRETDFKHCSCKTKTARN